MNKRILFPTLLLCILYMPACKKDSSYSVNLSGNVLDPNQNQGVSNVTIILSASIITSGTYNSNYTEIASTTTDGNGNYSFVTGVSGKPVGFRITVIKSGFFFNSIDLNSSVFENNNPYVQNFNIYSEAYLKLHVSNVSPNDSTDRINFYYTTQPSLHCNQCCSDNVITGAGTTYSISSVCKTYGGEWTKIIWTVAKSGALNYHLDSVFCNSFDTAQYNINY